MARRKKNQEDRRSDVVGTVGVCETVKTCYWTYGISVNTNRALPSIYDGLKPVQRRLLLALNRMPSGLHNATSVVGNTINYYHARGSSGVEGAIGTMINKYKPLLSGKGNFGRYRSLSGSQPGAAMRYVKVGASPLFESMYGQSIQYAPTFLNENDYQESEYLPTMIPYCLICGADGIGVGCATKIPHCNTQDLLNVAKLILQGKDKKAQSYKVRPIPDGGIGNLEITDEQLEKFNSLGECQVKVSADIEQVWDEEEGRTAYVITNFPENVNPAKILISLRTELDEKLVYIRDESDKTLRIVVGREKRIKRITDEELFHKLQRCTSVKCSYRNYVVIGDVAKVATPYEMIKASCEKLIEAEKLSLEAQLVKVTNQIIFELYKQDVAKQLMSDEKKSKPEDILWRIHQEREGAKEELTIDHVKFILGKSISMLKSSPKDVNNLYKEQSNLHKWIANPHKYYLDHKYSAIASTLI